MEVSSELQIPTTVPLEKESVGSKEAGWTLGSVCVLPSIFNSSFLFGPTDTFGFQKWQGIS